MKVAKRVLNISIQVLNISMNTEVDIIYNFYSHCFKPVGAYFYT